MVETIRCDHCGAEAKHPVTKTIDGRALHFCCAGCQQIYELMREEGIQPEPSGRGTPMRLLTELISNTNGQLNGTIPSKTIILSIAGMMCANCVAHVESGLRSVPGVLNASVNLAAGRATVEMIPGAVTVAALKRAVEDAGYKVLQTGDA